MIKMKIEKKELKKLYIDEKMSIQRILKIYKCNWITIKRNLKKYKIPIRSRGSFLIDDDGEFLKSKLSQNEYENERVKNKGFKNKADYENELTKNKGFKNKADYDQKMRFKRGIGSGLSMYENKKNPMYLGVVIAERILPKIFNDVKTMPYGNKGYDVVCNRNLKIDVKSSSLHKNNKWIFHIRKNKIADYFFMIVFDNRNDLNVMHIWLIKSDAVIEKINHYNSKEFIVNEIQNIHIREDKSGLKHYEQYEMTDKLDEVQKICDEFKINN